MSSRPARLLLDGELEGAAQLAEDLELTGHHRVEARGDAEEVGRDAAVEVHAQVVVELGRGEPGHLGEGRR